MLHLAGLVAAAPCDAPRTSAEVELALNGAEAAWGVDESAFQRAAATATDALPCIEDPVGAGFAARYHRVVGLRAFLAGDDASASRAFAAAVDAEPAYSFPEAMVPPENPLRTLYERARSLPDASAAVPPPAPPLALRFDGVETRERPTFRPTLFQLVAADGRAATAWVAPGEALPPYRLRGQGLRTPLLVAAGAGAVASGALLASAWAAEGEMRAAPSRAEAERARDMVNALSIASGGAGGVAVALGTGAFLFARW